MPLEFNDAFFDQILTSQGVQDLCRIQAEAVLAEAVRNAPVGDTGDYRNGLRIERVRAQYRWVYRVVGADEKTMIIESRTGNLARAIRSVMK